MGTKGIGGICHVKGEMWGKQVRQKHLMKNNVKEANGRLNMLGRELIMLNREAEDIGVAL
jgi:hypothetical protein